MRRLTPLLILFVLAVGSAAFAVEATGTYADAKALALQDNKPLLVDFSTSW